MGPAAGRIGHHEGDGTAGIGLGGGAQARGEKCDNGEESSQQIVHFFAHRFTQNSASCPAQAGHPVSTDAKMKLGRANNSNAWWVLDRPLSRTMTAEKTMTPENVNSPSLRPGDTGLLHQF